MTHELEIEREMFTKALHNAIYWQNLCVHLYEIIEMMCLDAEDPEQPIDRACTWTPSGDPNEPGTWSASCGAAWTFTDGGPVENDVHYCHKCGGALQIEGVRQ